MNFLVRSATTEDESKIFELYRTVAKNIGGIAREEFEITQEHIKNNLTKSLKNGVNLVIDNPDNVSQLIAEIHCYKLEPKVFDHVLSELTIVIHPDFQGKGIGKLLFNELFMNIRFKRTDILRIELIARESNAKAIELYQKLGFKIEGRFENRIKTFNGGFEADIPMAWSNPDYKTYLLKIPENSLKK